MIATALTDETAADTRSRADRIAERAVDLAHRRHPRTIGEVPVHDHRPDELIPQPIRHVRPAGLASTPVRERNGTITDDRLGRKVDELEERLRRDDPALAYQFNRLDRAHTRIDVTVFSLLVAAAVLLAIALATTSPVAGFGGIMAYVAAFGVDDHRRRKFGRGSTPANAASPWR